MQRKYFKQGNDFIHLCKKKGAKLKLIMFYSKVLAEIKRLRMHGY